MDIHLSKIHKLKYQLALNELISENYLIKIDNHEAYLTLLILKVISPSFNKLTIYYLIYAFIIVNTKLMNK